MFVPGKVSLRRQCPARVKVTLEKVEDEAVGRMRLSRMNGYRFCDGHRYRACEGLAHEVFGLRAIVRSENFLRSPRLVQ
jgi:hypothetical protein